MTANLDPAVAAVVHDGEPAHLIAGQRRQAVQAMHDLGMSREHIAHMLMTSRVRINEVARDLGISLHKHDQTFDQVAIDAVVTGTRMRLRGADRVEAVRRLAPRLTTGEIARRIGCAPDVVKRIANELEIETVPAQIRWHAPQSAAA